MSKSPSLNRRALLPALASASAVAGGVLSASASAAPAPQSVFQLTDLGRALLAQFPAEGLASWLDVNTTDAEWAEEYDADYDAEIDALGERSWNRVFGAVAAIHAAARIKPLDHIADLAVAARYRQIDWNGIFTDGRDEGECEADEHEDSSLFLLTRAVLMSAGISEDSLNADLIHHAEGAKHRAQCGTCQSCRNFAEVEAERASKKATAIKDTDHA